jgi:hypothetical protein
VKRSLLAGCILALSLVAISQPASAGSGYYYGADFGLFEFFDEDETVFPEGGFEFGPRMGIYFISQGLAMIVDVGVNVGLVGEDLDQWFFELPTLDFQVGTGFDAFMIYAGFGLGFFGLDQMYTDDISFNLLDPKGIAGIQVGLEAIILRGEFQIGHQFRTSSQPDYTYTVLNVTLGYGLYTDFL